MSFLLNPYMMGKSVLGDLWIYGTYGTSQNLTGGLVFFNAEQVDSLNAFGGSGNVVVVPTDVTESTVWARVFHDGLTGSPSAFLWARIQLSTDGGSTWTTVSEGTVFHSGGSTNTAIVVPEVTVTVAAGHRFRVAAGSDTPLAFGRVIYANDPNQTYLRATWKG